MRLIYIGSGEFGLPTLTYLHEYHEIVAVVSQPDKPAGRRRQMSPTPVADWAQASGLRVLKSGDVNADEFIEQVAGMNADASVVIAFGQKLSDKLIKSLGKLAVNLHASLLPKYRGAAPINWAMINNEKVTGVSVIALAQRMDAGDVYAAAEIQIDPLETAGQLHDRLAELGPEVVGKVLGDLELDCLHAIGQDESQATRAPKLSKSDGTVDFNQPVELVRARIHGLTPWPGCRVIWHSQSTGTSTELILKRVSERMHFADLKTGEACLPGVVIDEQFHVAVAGGAVRLVEVQVPGGKTMSVDEFARGHHLSIGDSLSAIT